jgi:poly(hydroxyalkanoate) depolymerase family esterase
MKLKSRIFAQIRAALRSMLSKVLPGVRSAVPAETDESRSTPAATPAPVSSPVSNPVPVSASPVSAPAPIPVSAAHKATAGKTARRAPKAAPAKPAHTPTSAQEFAQDFMARLGVPDALSRNGFASAQPAQELPPGAQFISGSYSNAAGTRDYKLYVPSTCGEQPMPLLVMLHGCTQNPDDFAAGTQMNALAEEKQCLVAYPAQAKSVNPSKCWNWFNALDQKRDQGEPSIIAGIAQHVMEEYAVDPRQVFVAGLSAGGAMAVIVGTLYPEVFAAVGVHSGLPFASARDLPSALAAMRSGASPARGRKNGGIPIIVFHGDRDTTVHPRNGDELMSQGVHNQTAGKDVPATSVREGSVPNGHSYTQTTQLQADGSPLAEHWVIHGAGHAWSGGSAQGTYTDDKGPDASREMMRFFETVA